MARKGLLKSNDRLFVPLVILPQANIPECSPTRLHALTSGLPIPCPIEDPNGWSGRKVQQAITRGFLGKKSGQYQVVLLLPHPSVYPKNWIIPYRIKITSSDTEITSTFPLSSVSVSLVQRVDVSAQGQPGVHELLLSQGVSTNQGPPDGETTGSQWGKRIQGTIQVPSTIVPTFTAPNIKCQYVVFVRITAPGPGSDVCFFSPITLVASERWDRPASSSVPQTPAGEAAYDFPPSYFEVTTMEPEHRGK